MPECKSSNNLLYLRKTGFTLIEMILIITIIAIVMAVGSRYIHYAADAKKYYSSMHKLTTIKRAIVGDERLVTLGNRADMGYFENNYAFPGAEVGNTVPTAALRDYFSPVPELDTLLQCESYKYDDFGQLFNYQIGVARAFPGSNYDYVQIQAAMADGVFGGVPATVFGEDIEILIRQDLFEENLINANIMDHNGVVLRGCPNRTVPAGITGAPWQHQIFRMNLEDNTGAVEYGTGQADPRKIFYYQGLFTSRDDTDIIAPIVWPSNPIPAGFYRMHVWPTNGSGASAAGLINHRDDLSGSNSEISKVVVIYPKDPESVNFLDFRLPGAVDVDEL